MLQCHEINESLTNRDFSDNPAPHDSFVTYTPKRSEVVQRLLAQVCELCGATDNIEVHHIRKLADLEQAGQSAKPDWVKAMATRQRKTLVVCQSCHHAIHYGRYDKPSFSK